MEMATVTGSSRSSRTSACEGTAVSDSSNLTAWLLAAGRDEAPALLHRGRTVTYGQLQYFIFDICHFSSSIRRHL